MELRPILLVEDNPDDVELKRRAFKRANILNKLVVAGDGMEALEYLHGNGTSVPNRMPSVILLDLKLPRMGGLEVLEKIRGDERTHNIPVIILTSSREDEDVSHGYAEGANSYIRKPIEFEEFVK